MNHPGMKKLIAGFVTLTLAFPGVAPAMALAEQRAVQMENHSQATPQATTVHDLVIDGVDKPELGSELDRSARVTAADDVAWDVPVLWVRDDLAMGDVVAAEGRSYLPVLAFFVPQEYALEGDLVTVTLSDGLTELFGSDETISVYDSATGITYIVPASIKDLFTRVSPNGDRQASDQERQLSQESRRATNDDVAVTRRDDPPQGVEDLEDDSWIIGLGGGGTMVEVYCAQTARNVLSDAELQWLLELIIDQLEPQAVQLLLKSFPSFAEGAAAGEIGKQIGLYVYYKRGDRDGYSDHEGLPDALAFVMGDAMKVDGELKYGYLVGVDVEDLLVKDDADHVVLDKEGYGTLVRSGEQMDTFANTIVHELFHALEHDYNRTGMSGGLTLTDILTDDSGRFVTPGGYERYQQLRYPRWFTEGTASMMENTYQFRYHVFQGLRRQKGDNGYGTGPVTSQFTKIGILTNYIYGKDSEGKDSYYELPYASGKDENGNAIDTMASRYVSGYLACLYLSELAARNEGKGSSVKTSNGTTTIDSSVLRAGMDSLMRRMHEGASLDEVIRAVSPLDSNTGQPIYTDSDSFAERFIKGPVISGQYFIYEDSLDFVEKFLNYMLALDQKLPEGERPNGSILFDFDKRFNSPLDLNAKVSSPYMQIADSNVRVPSTVKPDEAVIGGGKTPINKVKTASVEQAEQADDGVLPMAAKEGAEATVAQTDGQGAPAAELPAASDAASDAVVAGDATSAAEGAAVDVAQGEEPANTADLPAADLPAAEQTAGERSADLPETGSRLFVDPIVESEAAPAVEGQE